MRSSQLLSTLVVLLAVTVTAPGDAGAAETVAAAKLQHYCTYWGSAGLYPEDAELVAQNPLATIEVATANGTLSMPLLYIWKGHELDEQPREWKKIWDGFAQACPGWPKPAWFVKLEAWQAANQGGGGKTPGADPRVEQRRIKIKALLAAADAKEAAARARRHNIEQSAAYRAITGGRANWYQAAQDQATRLKHEVGLASVSYTVIGVVTARAKGQLVVSGMAISPANATAPGTRVQSTAMTIKDPRSEMARSNGHFFGQGLFLSALVAPTAQPTFGTAVRREARTQAKNAKAELRRIEGVIRNGKTRLSALMRPAQRLEDQAKRLRAQAKKLQGQNTAQR